MNSTAQLPPIISQIILPHMINTALPYTGKRRTTRKCRNAPLLSNPVIEQTRDNLENYTQDLNNNAPNTLETPSAFESPLLDKTADKSFPADKSYIKEENKEEPVDPLEMDNREPTSLGNGEVKPEVSAVVNLNENKIEPSVEPRVEPLEDASTEEKDAYLRNIEQQIANKKRMLLKKRKELDEAKKDNEHLEGVRQDYEKYRQYIAKTKQQELNAMMMLKSYIDDLVVNGHLTNTDLDNAKLEHARILKETDKIKKDLDEMIAV